MNVIFLQEQKMMESAMSLSDYGVLGIFALLMIGVIIILGKHFFELHKRNAERIKELEDNHDKYLAEDRKVILETLADCKIALENSTKQTEKLIEIFEKKKTIA